MKKALASSHQVIKESHMDEKKEKSFWGKGIFIFYVLFMIGMLTLVKTTTTANLDLVNEDYYADSEKYQEVIEAKRRTAELDSKPQISVSDGSIVIKLPSELIDKTQKETAVIYSPKSSKEDIQLKPTFNEEGAFEYKTNNLRKGAWDINFVWQDKPGNTYMISQRINL